MYPRESESVARLADVVRAHRHKAGMTQQELAAKAGLSLAALRDLEQGRHARPRPGSLAALAQALDLDPHETAELASSAAQAPRRRTAASREPDQEVAGIGAAESRPGLWVTVLGPLEVWVDGTSLPLGPPGRRAVLGLLAMDPGAVVRRDSVMEVLWGHRAPSTAVSLVQAHVSRLRKILTPEARNASAGEEIIASAGGGYRLRLRSEQLDLLTFRKFAAGAEVARMASDSLTAYERYEQALELWRGEPMADVDVLHDQPAIVEQRRELTEVLLRYAELACALGFHDRVLPRLHALAAAEPLNERVHARLMIALAGAGQQAAAVRVYEELRARLDREFAIYPSEELVEAHLRVLRQDLPVLRRSYGQRTSAHVVPRQLPASARYFTGRDRERDVLSGLLDRASPEAGEVVVAALTGMAGIGKTALAVNWAHQVADRFPDGQLFVNLLGFSSSGPPLVPGEALGGFLAALGVPSARIPADTAGKAALYRSMLASRRVLIVLDNARDAEQVRPLLPGSPGSMVLVTSRHRLTGLAAADGAYLVTLGGLTEGESYSLLTRVVGTGKVIAERGATGELIARCAGLPLALCNAAARPAAWPGMQLATLAAEMRDDRGRLDALETGESATSVRMVFSLSQARLSDPAWKMFQMLGLHPGPEITVPAAAAMAAFDWPRAQMALAELCDEHLLSECGPGRYACHELLRAYAAEAAGTHISETDRRAAVYRMLDYYLHTASASSILLFPILAPRALGQPRQGVLPEFIGNVSTAARWAESERSVLLGVIGQAAEGGYYPHAWELPWAAGWFFSGQECWRELAAAQETALKIAAGVGDFAGLALAHHHLGWLRFWLGEGAEAYRHLDGFIELAIRLGGGRFGAARDLATRVRPSQGGIPQALVYAGRALRLYRPVDGELNSVTWRLSQCANDRGTIGYGFRVLTHVTRLA